MEKVQILLFLVLAFAYAHDAEIEFEDTSIDNWKLLIGANAKELHYDFCKYNATSGGTQCTNFPNAASINIKKVCNCSVNHNKTTFALGVICSSNLSWCPKNLDLKYQHGPFEEPSQAEESSKTLLVFSIIFNISLIIGLLAVLKLKYNQRSERTELPPDTADDEKRPSGYENLIQPNSKKQKDEVGHGSLNPKEKGNATWA